MFMIKTFLQRDFEFSKLPFHLYKKDVEHSQTKSVKNVIKNKMIYGSLRSSFKSLISKNTATWRLKKTQNTVTINLFKK